jgi:hypothetical protein
MRRVGATGIAGAVCAVVAIVAIAGSALAYFSATGAGTATAGVTKLTASTLATPTPGGGQVTLSWSAASVPGTGTVAYYVTRDGKEPAGTCPGIAEPEALTSCVDTGVPIGAHEYKVIAVWRSWTAVSGAKSATVATGAATKFVIAAAKSNPAAAESDNLTITVKDAAGNTVTTYTGSHTLVFAGASASPGGTKPTVANSSGTATNFGTATALTFTAGVAAVTSSKNGLLKIYDAGTAEVTATEGSITTPSPLVLSVAPLVATKFTLAADTTTPVTGAEDDLTITALDTYGNTATAYTGAKSIVFSGASNGPGGDVSNVTSSSGADVAFGTATAIAFSAGVAIPTAGTNGTMTIYKSGTASIRATEGTLTNSTALAFTVVAGSAVKFVLTASTVTPVANATLNLTTTAQDSYGNAATSYTGSHNIVFSGAEPSPSGTAATVVNAAGTAISFGAATALTFTNGAAAVTSSKNGLTRLNKAGTTSITATDGTISTAAPLVFTVAVGAAAKLALLNLVKSGGTAGSPCLFTCAITGLGNSGTVNANVAVTDSMGNTVSNLGSGHAIKVAATTGGTIANPALTLPETGAAVSTAKFVYTAPASGSFTHTITAATSAGTVYTSATATVTK